MGYRDVKERHRTADKLSKHSIMESCRRSECDLHSDIQPNSACTSLRGGTIAYGIWSDSVTVDDLSKHSVMKSCRRS